MEEGKGGEILVSFIFLFFFKFFKYKFIPFYNFFLMNKKMFEYNNNYINILFKIFHFLHLEKIKKQIYKKEKKDLKKLIKILHHFFFLFFNFHNFRSTSRINFIHISYKNTHSNTISFRRSFRTFTNIIFI